jgi:hypothetical protein
VFSYAVHPPSVSLLHDFCVEPIGEVLCDPPVAYSLCPAFSYETIRCSVFTSLHTFYIQVPFEKFVDSPYYTESELCGGAVTVSFSKCLPSQAMHFLQLSTRFSKTCCRPLITSKFLTSELPFHSWESPEISWGEIWTVWRIF